MWFNTGAISATMLTKLVETRFNNGRPMIWSYCNIGQILVRQISMDMSAFFNFRCWHYNGLILATNIILLLNPKDGPISNHSYNVDPTLAQCALYSVPVCVSVFISYIGPISYWHCLVFPILVRSSFNNTGPSCLHCAGHISFGLPLVYQYCADIATLSKIVFQ